MNNARSRGCPPLAGVGGGKRPNPDLDFITKLRPVTYHLNAADLELFLHRNNNTVSRETNAALTMESVAAKASYDKALQEKESIIYTGFVAQEVETAAKNLDFNFSGIDAPKNADDVYALRYADFVVPLVKAVQEQQQIIETLKQENNNQKNTNAVLQQQIDALKALIKH